jgi:Fur family peroxide stress response transcriptional regulator
MRNSERALAGQRLEHWRAAAKEAGVKPTHRRLERSLEPAATEGHPDAESLFRAVQERVPTVSLDTVYRTLWMLHDLGLVATLGPRRDGIRFDANLDQHHHDVCVRCGLVRDLESEELNGLRVPGSVEALGGILGARVEVRGVCARCQQGESNRRKARERAHAR